MFSYLSWSSISLATVTPSLVIVGLPNFLSMTTLRPFGPSVALTASAITFMPLSRAARASSLNLSCFGMSRLSFSYRCIELFQNGEDVFFPHDYVLFVLDLDLVARVLAEENPVAALHVQRDLLAFLGHLPVPHRDDFPFLGLFLGGVGDDNSTAADFLLFHSLDKDAVMQRTDLHRHRRP